MDRLWWRTQRVQRHIDHLLRILWRELLATPRHSLPSLHLSSRKICMSTLRFWSGTLMTGSGTCPSSRTQSAGILRYVASLLHDGRSADMLVSKQTSSRVHCRKTRMALAALEKTASLSRSFQRQTVLPKRHLESIKDYETSRLLH